MIKYFSDKLKNLTPAQRTIALTLLLLTVFLLTTLPIFIKNYKDDNKVLVNRVILLNRVNEELNSDVKKLTKDNDSLNYKLRVNQIECTNLVIRREKEIMLQISSLEENMLRKETISPIEKMIGQQNNDSINVIIPTFPELNTDFLLQVRRIKSDLQKSINNKNEN